MANSRIEFYMGLQSAYDFSKSKNIDALYFASDTQRFFIGETEYTRPVLSGEELPQRSSPNSLFVLQESDKKSLWYTKDGTSYEVLLSSTPPAVEGGIFGENQNLSPNMGDNIVIPKLTINESGYVTEAENQNVKLPVVTINSQIVQEETLEISIRRGE